MSSFEKIITHVLKYFPQKIIFIETYPFAGKNCQKNQLEKIMRRTFIILSVYTMYDQQTNSFQK